MSLRRATAWSVAYVALALAFGAGLGLIADWGLAGEYLAGYAVEKSLSIDNLFVFVVIMGSFAVPSTQQPRALTIGFAAALGLRAGFIVVGAALLHAFTPAFALFGVILLATAVQLLRHRGQTPKIADGRLVAWLRRRTGSPMRLAIFTMIGADLLFALDSIPAIYGVTEHPLIVLAANAFALLGLRPLFFVVGGLVRRLHYLPLGMAAILAFIGAKLVLHGVHASLPALPTISTAVSLAVIIGVLAVTAAASLWRERAAQMGARPHSRHPAAATR